MSAPQFLRSALLGSLGIEHGFGTRGAEAEIPSHLLHARQVHGARVVRVPPLDPDVEADALVTETPGVAVAVFTADCVPLLLADAGGRAVAAVHAGWRGSAQGIAEGAVAALARAARCPPETLVAAIGPHIGPCCYEVDEPVRAAVGEQTVFSVSSRPDHYQLDLFELNRGQLLGAGLRPERIDRIGGCTACDATLFYSYRREGRTGRLLSYARCPNRLADEA